VDLISYFREISVLSHTQKKSLHKTVSLLKRVLKQGRWRYFSGSLILKSYKSPRELTG